MQQTTRLVRLLSAALMATAASASFAADPAPAQPAQQVAQAQPADPAVAAQAAAVLQQDKDLQALPLTVSSTTAGVIVVKGAAPSADLAQKAIKLVAAVPGVKEVRNLVQVVLA